MYETIKSPFGCHATLLQRNGCLSPNHFPFPLFGEHEEISKFTNHASPSVMERTNHVTVIYRCVNFPSWIRKLADIAEIPYRCKSEKKVESSLSVHQLLSILTKFSLKVNSILLELLRKKRFMLPAFDKIWGERCVTSKTKRLRRRLKNTKHQHM